MFLLKFIPLFVFLSCGATLSTLEDDSQNQSKNLEPPNITPQRRVQLSATPEPNQEERFINIQGLTGPNPVHLTVKKNNGEIVGVLKAYSNQKVALTSLNLEKKESYVVLAESEGYKSSFQPISIDESQKESGVIAFEKISSDYFSYHWESDFSNREQEFFSYVPIKNKIEFLDEVISTPESSASQKLFKKYNIILSNESVPWTFDYGTRLLKVIESIPHNKFENSIKFILKNENIEKDIKIENINNQKIVTLSTKSFNNASPRMVLLDGVKGRFFHIV